MPPLFAQCSPDPDLPVILVTSGHHRSWYCDIYRAAAALMCSLVEVFIGSRTIQRVCSHWRDSAAARRDPASSERGRERLQRLLS
jgi:hypothetical protein